MKRQTEDEKFQKALRSREASVERLILIMKNHGVSRMRVDEIEIEISEQSKPMCGFGR